MPPDDEDDFDHTVDIAPDADNVESLDDFITARPLTALAIAAAVGFLVARIVF